MYHCSIRCTLTPNFLFGFKLYYVSRYLKNTSQQILDKGNLRSDIPQCVWYWLHILNSFILFLMNTETTKINVIKVYLFTFILNTGLNSHAHLGTDYGSDILLVKHLTYVHCNDSDIWCWLRYIWTGGDSDMKLITSERILWNVTNWKAKWSKWSQISQVKVDPS